VTRLPDSREGFAGSREGFTDLREGVADSTLRGGFADSRECVADSWMTVMCCGGALLVLGRALLVLGRESLICEEADGTWQNCCGVLFEVTVQTTITQS
jgi:hypothetical protein